MVWEPLTKLQCCPTSDGAGAAIVVSEHLKVLKDAGLVVARREGKQQIYRVVPDGPRFQAPVE